MPGTLRIGAGDDDDERPTITVEPAGETRPGLVGQLIGGRYRVDALLGEGGMGAVFRGEHVRMRKRVAIKVLRPETERLPELVARFEREAIAGAHVSHPNVASATDFGQLDDGSYYLVLEYVEGESLADVVARGPLRPERAARIARAIAAALAAVHDKGIVHRDVKPRNVMITPPPSRSAADEGPAESGAGEGVKLIDFGLAKVSLDRLSEKTRSSGAATKAGPALTAAGTVVGTIAYLAPEAALGMDAVDARADLYALGVVLFEMLAGQRPFEGRNDGSLFKHQRFSPPPRIGERAPGVVVPAPLEAIALRLLEKNPAARYQTAGEVVRALDALDALVEVQSERVLSQAPSAPPETPSLSSISSIPGLPRRRGASLQALVGKLPLWAAVALLAGGIGLALIVIALAGRGPAGSVAREPALGDTNAVAPPPQPAAASSRVGRVDGASADPRSVEGLDAAAWRARLHHAVGAKDYDLGARAFLALAEIDEPALDEGAVRSDVVAVAAGVAFEGNELAERVFDTMANKLGPRGTDLLFEIVRSRGATHAGRRANELLRRPDVIGRGTPALRVAYGLHSATCVEKPALFGRAADDGDGRALAQLVVLKDADCKRKDPCCFRDDAALAEAIKKLKAKLR